MNVSTRVITDINSITEPAWNRLDHGDNPFLSHAFLGGLESSGSVGPHSGWQPHHLALFEGDELAAIAPSYIKSHSHGEFVFDWAWADAYHRHGLQYYPKLLTGIPYSPVTGPRLLTRCGHPDPGILRRQLINFARDECDREDLSSWHVNFVADDDEQVLRDSPLLRRRDWQFHWRNDGYADFDDFLGRLRSRKRKNIRRERRQVNETKVQLRHITGDALQDDDLDFIHRCYLSTFRAYRNHPALNRDFFAHIATQLKEQLIVIEASRDGAPIAMALFLAGGGRLYGRYWGCEEDIPGLHFEVAYYQGIEYCIRHGLDVFESGAQGEHKISRGFLPTPTRSFHLIREEAFRSAISDYLLRENGWINEYREQLAPHDPYRRDTA